MVSADNTAVGLDIAFNDGQPRRQVNVRIHVNGRDCKAVHSAASGGFVFDPPMYVPHVVAWVHGYLPYGSPWQSGTAVVYVEWKRKLVVQKRTQTGEVSIMAHRDHPTFVVPGKHCWGL